MRKIKTWTKQEEEILKQNYYLGYKKCKTLLGRDKGSIISKAGRLGLSNQNQKISQKEAIKRFRDKGIVLLDSYKNNITKVLCQCYCGNKWMVIPSLVWAGNTRSCGCYVRNKGPENPHWKGYGLIAQSYFAQVKMSAERRKFEFTLSIKDFLILWNNCNGKCCLCDIDLIPPKIKTNKSNIGSLDRIDSNKGYTIDNCQWLCWKCNDLKSNWNQEEFLNHCVKIIKNLGLK